MENGKTKRKPRFWEENIDKEKVELVRSAILAEYQRHPDWFWKGDIEGPLQDDAYVNRNLCRFDGQRSVEDAVKDYITILKFRLDNKVHKVCK